MVKNNFLKKFQNWNFQHKLISKGDKIVVGVSGGPDSTVLVLLLKKFSEKNKLFLHLVHINYNLRGKDSKKDEDFVRKLAKENNLPLDVIEYKKNKNKRGNLEEILRNFRYKEFEKIRKKKKFDFIAIGHTLDDKVETVLMNIIRGAGTDGVTALKERNNFIIRPLINFEKERLIEFLDNQKQKYQLDKSNLDINFFRNKIRRQLIPLLEKEYNPGIKKAILNLSENIGFGSGDLEEITEYCYNKVVNQKKDFWEIEVENIKKLPKILLKNIFRKVILEIKGDLKNVSSANFNEFEKLVFSRKNKIQAMKMANISIKKSGKKIFVKNF